MVARGRIWPLLTCRRGWVHRGRRDSCRSRPGPGQLLSPEGVSQLLVSEPHFQTILWPKRPSTRFRVRILFQGIQTTNQLIFGWTQQGEGGGVPGDKLSPHPALPIGGCKLVCHFCFSKLFSFSRNATHPTPNLPAATKTRALWLSRLPWGGLGIALLKNGNEGCPEKIQPVLCPTWFSAG